MHATNQSVKNCQDIKSAAPNLNKGCNVELSFPHHVNNITASSRRARANDEGWKGEEARLSRDERSVNVYPQVIIIGI